MVRMTGDAVAGVRAVGLGNVRFTGSYVRRIADTVETATDGLFSLGEIGADLGNGKRYIDGVDSTLVWSGDDGARCAVAYYVGGFMGWLRAERREVPPGVVRALQEAQHTLYRTAKYRDWMDRGEARAVGRARGDVA